MLDRQTLSERMRLVMRCPLACERKMVLLMLHDRMGGNGVAWPSIKTLASDCGLSIRTLQRRLNELEKMGLVRRTPTRRDDGGSKSNEYTIDYEQLARTSERQSDTPGERPPDTGGVSAGQEGPRPADRGGGVQLALSSKEEPPSRNLPIGTSQMKSPPTPKGGESERMFDSFWRAYPRKVGKSAAVKAWRKALRTIAARGLPPMGSEAAAAWLAERASAFARSDAGQRGEFTPHPSTWLNQARYDDDDDEWRRTDGSGAGGRGPDRAPSRPAVSTLDQRAGIMRDAQPTRLPRM